MKSDEHKAGRRDVGKLGEIKEWETCASSIILIASYDNEITRDETGEVKKRRKKASYYISKIQ